MFRFRCIRIQFCRSICWYLGRRWIVPKNWIHNLSSRPRYTLPYWDSLWKDFCFLENYIRRCCGLFLFDWQGLVDAISVIGTGHRHSVWGNCFERTWIGQKISMNSLDSRLRSINTCGRNRLCIRLRVQTGWLLYRWLVRFPLWWLHCRTKENRPHPMDNCFWPCWHRHRKVSGGVNRRNRRI